MKHLKIYEETYYDDKFEKYAKFISDKFEIYNHPFGKVNFDYITDDRLIITIKLGGDIEPKYLNSIINFFEDSVSVINIQLSGEYIYYKLKLTYDFLKKLDMEMESKKYNI